MTVFPLIAAVTVVLDGKPLPAYNAAVEINGRVVAPLRPVITSIADRIWFEGNTLVIERGGRTVRIPAPGRAPDTLNRTNLPIAPILRSLGADVTYNARRHRVDVRFRPEATPASAQPQEQTVTPRPVFTPTPPTTPRPLWTGSPLPRRTPLPYSSPDSRDRP